MKSQLAQLSGQEPAEAEPPEEDDAGEPSFDMLRSGVPLAVFFTRVARPALRSNPFSGAPDGVDWGQVESVARLNSFAVDSWAFDTLNAMFAVVEKAEMARWSARQKEADRNKKAR